MLLAGLVFGAEEAREVSALASAFVDRRETGAQIRGPAGVVRARVAGQALAARAARERRALCERRRANGAQDRRRPGDRRSGTDPLQEFPPREGRHGTFEGRLLWAHTFPLRVGKAFLNRFDLAQMVGRSESSTKRR
jgi:hypothetical protein